MYLALKDLAFLFQNHQGAKEDIEIHTVTDDSKHVQPKGVFVPTTEESGELLEAIANGAIAAIWDKNKKIPGYTPNHFPLFFTNDPVEAIQRILQLYLEKLEQEETKVMKTTKFKFLNQKLLNKSKQSYDIAVILQKISGYNNPEDQERRG